MIKLGENLAQVRDGTFSRSPTGLAKASKLDMRVIKAEVDRQFKEMQGSIIASGVK